MRNELRYRQYLDGKMLYMTEVFVGVGQLGFSDDIYVDLGQHDHEQSVIMRSSGLIDKAGKLVYDGDIVRYAEGMAPMIQERIGQIKDMGWKFILCNQRGQEMEQEVFLNNITTDLGGFTVIGNIYESPQMLGNQNDSAQSIAIA